MTDVLATPSEDTPAAAPVNPALRWYVVHAYSGMEKAVERNILERIARSGMENKFGRILVPMEEVVEVKNGQKKTTERKFFPGYVLVEMVMDDDTWHLVKHTNKVTGFVGGAKEAIQITAYVFGFVFIMALFLWLTDKTLEWVFYDLILGWKK